MKFLNGFRKWSMAVIFLVVAISLLISGKIPSSDWLKHVSGVMVAFFGSNVGEHIINAVKNWRKSDG